jgi:hypothetical protein
MNEASKIPRRVMPFLVVVLIAGIVVPAILLYQIRSRFDLGVWLWGLLAIAAIFAISVPILSWQEKYRKHSRSFPWPVLPVNPYFGKGTQRNVSLEGTLTWTTEIFKRMATAVVRFTPSGRDHRRTVYTLSLIGAVGTVLGAVYVYQHELGGLALIAASALLITFTYSIRIRVPDEMRCGTQIRWVLSQDRFRIEPVNLSVMPGDGQSTLVMSRDIHLACARAIIRTPAGFIIWPDDLIEFWLPIEAFSTAEQVETFHEIARSCVANYCYESDAR